MLISICIPVYNGETFLRRCLDSISTQCFRDFEIIVVDDCSPGKDENDWNCKKICKVFSRQSKIKVNYLRLSENKGCLEARRYAIYEAKGDYIFCLDCDDIIEPDCFERLAQEVESSKADIIQSGTKVVFANPKDDKDISEEELVNFNNMQNKANMLYEGTLQNENVFDYSIIKQKINYFVWGKLIKRSVFLSAMEMIPPCYCVWGEDYAIYFFVVYFAKKYIGIKDKLYVYSIDTGISSKQSIDTIERWEKVCSVSSAFTIIFDAINNGKIVVTTEQREAIQRQCNTYVLSTFRYLKYFVSAGIKEEAFNLFCEYWGTDYVNNILKSSGERL